MSFTVNQSVVVATLIAGIDSEGGANRAGGVCFPMGTTPLAMPVRSGV
jgi:hypothetical protein